VVTLGDDVLQALVNIPAMQPKPPVNSVVELYAEDRYASEGTLRVNDRDVRWLPLVHPGLLKGKPDLDGDIDPAARTLQGWNTLHGRWERDGLRVVPR
jgi:hypothetical protein